jgi:peptidoglycan LD-endopeptidase LytH
MIYNVLMEHIKTKFSFIFIIILLFSSHVALAVDPTYTSWYSRYRTYDIQSQSPDTGRNRMDSGLWNQINSISNQPVVQNVRIPILLGVTVANLEDTWGDARANGRTHEGIDIIVPKGTLVVSPTDAVVTTVENSGNGGNHVFTANPGGERFYYAHLDTFAPNLTEGQVLKAGDLIGYVGNTGNASGGPAHLHFGIYHNDHEATNPFSRLTQEFSLQERIDAVTKILSITGDPMALARTLVAQYRSVFLEAQIRNITLPTQITQVLGDKALAAASSIVRTLRLGSRGDDVKALQQSLGITVDGSFGPKTKAAVIAFQLSHNLTPDGVFGPASRAVLLGGSVVSGTNPIYPAGCTSSVGYSPLSGIKCTTVMR